MMGTGFLKRAARMKASSWVLSPISARATTPVETSRDSIVGFFQGPAQNAIDHDASPAHSGGVVVKGLARCGTACAMAANGPSMLTQASSG